MMDNIWDIMRARHSVRQYLNKEIEPEKVNLLNEEIQKINVQSGLYFVLCTNEPEVYQANKPHYGSFKNVRNYLICFGPKDADEQVGYYGEHLVLFAQSLNLNSCWCALTFEKNKLPVKAPEGMKVHDVIALGYGETQGVAHVSKPVIKLAKITIDTPQWFESGMDAVMLAPTAINQQRFFIEQVGERQVKAKALLGPYSKTDLGIVKYHFEIGAGKENFEWV